MQEGCQSVSRILGNYMKVDKECGRGGSASATSAMASSMEMDGIGKSRLSTTQDISAFIHGDTLRADPISQHQYPKI